MVDFSEVVRQVVDEARNAKAGGAALAQALERLGVAPGSGLYSSSAISNWAKGRAMPPADVLLALATLGEISLDAKIGLRAQPSADVAVDTTPGSDELRREVRDLQQKVGRLEALLMDLYARTGQPFPHGLTGSQTRTARASGQ